MTTPSIPTITCVCGYPQCPIPFGFCHCGCGKETSLHGKRAMTYCVGHKGHHLPPLNSLEAIARRKILSGKMCPCGSPECAITYGTCHCGCGEMTTIVTSKEANTRYLCYVGKPKIYMHNHHMRLSAEPYTVEDRGYQTACWIWRRSLSKKGYGTKCKGDGYSGTQQAHIWYWEQKNGPVPDGKMLDHLCRQRACCNPEHMEPVTNAENVQRGEIAVLTTEGVREVRARAAYGEKQINIALELGISPTTVSMIVKRKTWRNV
jgi:hypothetical protein